MKKQNKHTKKMNKPYTNTADTVVSNTPNITQVNLGTIGKVIVPLEVIKKFDLLHKEWPNKEWGGLLFYNRDESIDISNLKDIQFIVKDFYPMGLGDAGSNEFEYTDITKGIKAVEGLDYQIGLVHSHHTMSAFFSGTDINDLVVNHDKYDYYLSLVVNVAKSYVAKLAFAGTTKVVRTFKENGVIVESSNEESVMFIGDLTVELGIESYDYPEWFINRINELKEAMRKPLYTSYTSSYHTPPKSYNSFDDDYDKDWYQKWDKGYTPKSLNNSKPVETPITYTDKEAEELREQILEVFSAKEVKLSTYKTLYDKLNALIKYWDIVDITYKWVEDVEMVFYAKYKYTKKDLLNRLNELKQYFLTYQGGVIYLPVYYRDKFRKMMDTIIERLQSTN